MKKSTLLLSFIFFLSSYSPAQVVPSWISDDLFPDANSSTATTVAIDPSGNILVAGSVYDTDNPLENIFVVKYNPDGQVQWKQTYGTADTITMSPNTLCTDNQGNAYIVFMRHMAGSYSSIAVQKYGASDGEILWTSELAYAQFNAFEWQVKPKYMTIDDNHLYVAGTKFDSITGDREMLAMKLDMSGNILWTATNAGTGNSNSKCITVDANGNVYIAGDAWNASIDYCVTKFDANGNLIWDEFLDGDVYHNTDIAESVLVDDNGNVYITGYSQISSNQKDILTVKYDQNGNFQWKQSYGNPDYRTSNAYYLEMSESGDLYVGGYCAYQDPYPGRGKDYVLLKYTPSGSLVWDALYDYNNYLDDHPYDFDIGPEGNIYICGITMKSCYIHKFITAVKINPQGEIEWDLRVPNLFGTPWEISVIDEDKFVVAAGAFDTIQVNSATTILYETGTPPVYEADILDIYFESQVAPPEIDYENQTITATVHDTANIEYLVPYITRSEHSCMYPDDGVVTSFIEPIWYNVTSFDDEIEKWWIVTVEGGYVGTKEHESEVFQIYPNPAVEEFRVLSSEFRVSRATVALFGVDGRKLLEKTIPEGSEEITVDVRSLHSGIYFVRLTIENKSVTKKLVIK